MITGLQARVYIAQTNQTSQTIHPSDRFFNELHVVLHAYCRDAYAKYINGNPGAVKQYFTAP